ncbi:MAG: DUF3604 domain-containing protein [Halieaceae bacterium]
MARAVRILKIVLLVLAVLLLVFVLAGLWLRFEFERVKGDESLYDALMDVPVKSLLAKPHSARGCDQQYPNNNAWFGALHVHTAASYDATAFGVATTADSAYRFGRGEPLNLRLRGDPVGLETPTLQISSALDFMAVTDHAEGLGENRICLAPGTESYDALVCRVFRADLQLPVSKQLQPLLRIASLAIFGLDRSRRLCGATGELCREQAILAWQDNQRSTEAFHDSSGDCSFTTLHGYEYTLAEQSSNLHRNVIFSSAVVPQAIASAKEATTPEALWRWLHDSCIEGNSACNALAIPHNSNWSSGRMWQPYSNSAGDIKQQQDWAQLRAQVEPLAEVLQVKGDSECRNGIASVFGEADEFCDFEKLRSPTEEIIDCGESVGSGGMMLQGCTSRYNFVRYALTAGVAEREKLGVNPFEMGIVAATDTHIAAPAAGLERGFQGAHGIDRSRSHRLGGQVEVPGGIGAGSPVRYNPGGVAGVYAPENSRAALFAAMQRRETFGTSGPRIKPRFFAGWQLPEQLCQQPDMLETAYREAVPMGAVLPAPPAPAEESPMFMVSARGDMREGGNLLQRIQIIKGWTDTQGRTQQRVYDVAGDPSNGASVDPGTCAVSGHGFKQLCSQWRDPEFDPSVGAVYYARVLENPSCRWSHFDCLALDENERPASCSSGEVPWQIQERAWTSPIWYYPSN